MRKIHRIAKGCGLSVAFCEYLAELGLNQPDKLILFSPWLDISMSNPKVADFEAVDPMLSAYGLIEMGKCWAGDLDIKDYKVSPRGSPSPWRCPWRVALSNPYTG